MVTMQPQAITKVSISALVISLPIIYVSLLRVPPSALARDSTFWFLMSNSIIAIIAADSGMLFLDDDDHSEVVTGEQPAAAATVHEDYYSDAMPLPLMASSYEPTTAPMDMSDVVLGGGEQLLPTGGAASCKATGTGGMDKGHALALIEGEGAPRKPTTDMVAHASSRRRCEEEEEAPDLEPISANKNDEIIIKGDQYRISPAPLTVTPDDHVPQDEGSVDVVREEVKPRWCSVTEENKPPLEKERDYWQLSDDELNRKVEEFITRFNRDMIEQEAAAV
ncbi:hypothetical protein ACQ4PT_004470 [Festuca glaucescens]